MVQQNKQKQEKNKNEQIIKNTGLCYLLIPSNFNGSNTDGSFTMAYSNSFLSPYGIFPIAQENKYWGKVSYFIMKWRRF